MVARAAQLDPCILRIQGPLLIQTPYICASVQCAGAAPPAAALGAARRRRSQRRAELAPSAAAAAGLGSALQRAQTARLVWLSSWS